MKGNSLKIGKREFWKSFSPRIQKIFKDICMFRYEFVIVSSVPSGTPGMATPGTEFNPRRTPEMVGIVNRSQKIRRPPGGTQGMGFI